VEPYTLPLIRIANTGHEIETDLMTSLLVALQINGIPIDTVCGGRARCGRCAVRILSGERFLTKRRPAEILRLEAIGAGPEVRLACQTHTRGDIEIEVVNLRP
jgi:adenylate cyclase